MTTPYKRERWKN